MDNPKTLATLGTLEIGRQAKHNITQNTNKMSNTDLTKKPGVNTGAH
jgi:hypothetical protein